MMRDRICDVFQRHQFIASGCSCGSAADTKAHHDIHLADAVIAELGLRPDRVGTLMRWVSEWVPDE